MPIYISRGRFTSDAVKGMLAKPENREEAVANLFKGAGGRLIGWYLTRILSVGSCSISTQGPAWGVAHHTRL